MSTAPRSLTGVILLRGGPGQGKTAALVSRAREALEAEVPPSQVLCLALDAAAAESVRDRFLAGVGEGAPALPSVLTYEQVARRILAEAHGEVTGRFLDPLAERLLVGRALQETAAGARYFRERPLRESARFRDEVADFIAELKRHKLTPERFRQEVVEGLSGERSPEQGALEDLAAIYERYQAAVKRADVFDLRGLLWLALLALESPALAAAWRGRYRLVVADDLQDATPLHLELLAALAGPTTEVIGSYEPLQALYQFRGAVGNPGPWLGRLLADRRIEVQSLSPSTGGLPSAVAAVASQFAARFSLEVPIPCGTRSAGRVEYALYRSRGEEVDALGDRLVEALAAGECLPEEIAVFTRSEREARATAAQLALRGLPVRQGGGGTGEWQARRLLQDLLAILQATSGAASAAGAEGERQREAGRALARLADLIASPTEALRLPALARQTEDLLHADLPPDFPELSRLRDCVWGASGAPVTQSLLSVVRRLMAEASPENQSRLVGPLAALLGQICGVAEQLERLTGEPMSAEEAGTVLAEATIRSPFEAPGISVLTAHQARGRHYLLVFVLGLQEESFPAPPVVSRLLSAETVRALRERSRRVLELPEGVASFAGLGEAPAEADQEEQRLFLTCLTRSTDRLVLSAHLEEAGAPLTPSPYLAATLPEECVLGPGAEFACAFAGLLPARPGGREEHAGCPVVPCPHGLAHERRAALEVDFTPPLRRSRVPVLAEAADQYVLYPSGLGEYLRCPRRFLLKELLKVAPAPDSDAAVYGSAVHHFLQELNRRPPESRTLEAARGWLEAALAQVREKFSSALAAELYAARARAALELYLQTDLAARPTQLPERRMAFEVRDERGRSHRCAGRIDVAALVEGGVAVVDYKTGSIPSAKELRKQIPLQEEDARAGATQVQLPMYALAWEAQPGTSPVRQMCLQNFSTAEACKASCVSLTENESGPEVLTRAELDRFRQALAQWAAEIKAQMEFAGRAPQEGCNPFRGLCPFVGICDEAELF